MQNIGQDGRIGITQPNSTSGTAITRTYALLPRVRELSLYISGTASNYYKHSDGIPTKA